MAEPKKSGVAITAVVLFVLAGLSLVMLHGNAQLLNSQVKVWGESTWPGYNTAFTLGEVSCNLEKLKQNREAAERAVNQPKSVSDMTKGDDVDALFDDDDEPKATQQLDDVDALFEPEETPGERVNKKEAPDDVDALFDEDEPEPANKATEDDVDALFEDDEPQQPPKISEQQAQVLAAKAAEENCERKWSAFRAKQALITDGMQTYRGVHAALEAFVVRGTNYYQHFLVFILMLCALVTTVRSHHISLRPVQGGWSQLIASGSQLIVYVLLCFSFWKYREIQAGSVDADLANVWMIGLGLLATVVFIQAIKSFRDLGTFSSADVLAIPLFCVMGLASGVYFILIKDYPSGLAAKLGLISVNAKLYLQVGLYVWIGMLLKQSMLTQKVFDVVRPLKLAPELLSIVVVLGAAIPTAYSGASGIFVIAAGALIYKELKSAGAHENLALAATAMSGSMGVVLSPCLLVVIVASLDNSVTTAELFGWGAKVFALTAVLFAGLVIFTKRNPLTFDMSSTARGECAVRARSLLPYFGAFLVGLAFCYWGLGAGLNELWAPYLLPLFMAGFLIYERREFLATHEDNSSSVATKAPNRLYAATDESSLHIGALLLLMGMSVTLGAMVEDGALMEHLSLDMGNRWMTMSVLVVVLVIIGMTMDPYGAVILVAATISGVAKQAGIEMIHFWMVVLVAFELGYLTPPVALNHLLTRQVVGQIEVAPEPGVNFYRRHERYALPILVLGIALLVVAFGPLLLN